MIQMFLKTPLNLSVWNRKIRIAYWLIWILLDLSILGTWPFANYEGALNPEEFLWKYIIFQNGLIIAILLIAELVYRMNNRWQDYVIISIGSAFAAIIQGMAPIEVTGVQIVISLPILISILYFEYRKVIFASVSTLLPYLAIMLLHPSYRLEVPMYQKAVGYGIILFITLAGLGIVNRGLKVIQGEKAALMNEERHRLQQKANDEASSKDFLTGLYNHRCFQEHLRLAVETGKDVPLYLALIDIDNFKQINDKYGHLTGDSVIHQIGQLLKCLSDDSCFAARYGGEEFAVIIRGLNVSQTEVWLEEFRVQTERAIISELGDHNVTISIGCHQWKENEDRDFLFRQADAALYRAKRNGKNQVAW